MLAIEVSGAALQFAHAGGVVDVQPAFDPAVLITALDRAGVGYVLVGGLAGAAHGVVRASADIDLVPEPSRENLAALATLGAARPDHGIRTPWGDVHVIHAIPYADLRERAIALPLGDTEAVSCSRDDFRAMKLALGRPRDLIDVAELDELHGA
ncbi:hypothetical protein [Solirubrobacter soli]|uniref:hypothetical protein n=1 Tax=Solirubrobacter soli TaxID=363832 RepID=UPI000563AF5A|nr:hypothetical protein [Solirubrobacter soli]